MRNVWLPLAMALIPPGCGGGEPEGGGRTTADGGPKPLSGVVVITGSSTVYRISRAAQLLYTKKYGDDVEVLVDNRGTGGGFQRYLDGEADMVDASRPAKSEEEERARASGREWARFLVGYDGITVVVNTGNTFVKSLTVDQLDRLFRDGSRVSTWKQLDPNWPDREIVLYSPDTDSGTFEFFGEAVIDPKRRVSQRTDVQASPDDNTLVTGVSQEADGLGYFGYAYYAANREKLRPVPIQNGPDAAPVAPTPETILAGSYKPLSRPLYLYVGNSALKRPEVAHFMSYYLDHIEELATRAGYVPPTPADRSANQKALESSGPTS